MRFVQKYLVANGAKCSRHCDKPAKFLPLFQSDSSIVGGYVCPEDYVSRIVYFADNPKLEWFKKYLLDHIGKKTVHDADVRTATRHGWELGGRAEGEISHVSKSGEIVQYYWTPYPKTEEEKKYGVFVCPKNDGGCGRLYSKLKIDDSKICPNCRKG